MGADVGAVGKGHRMGAGAVPGQPRQHQAPPASRYRTWNCIAGQEPILASTSAFRNRSMNSMKPTDGTSRMSAVIEAI